MPIYQYRCEECGHELEALQKMSDPKLVDCPACSAPALKKQVTAAAFKLKGTGWYETDFKNSGAKPEPAKTTAKTNNAGDSSASGTKATSDKTTAATKQAAGAS